MYYDLSSYTFLGSFGKKILSVVYLFFPKGRGCCSKWALDKFENKRIYIRERERVELTWGMDGREEEKCMQHDAMQ